MPDQIHFRPGDPDQKPLKQQLFEAEARGWLRRGYNSPDAIERLAELLQEKRGKRYNVDRLVEEMRRQWARRAEWLHKAGSG